MSHDHQRLDLIADRRTFHLHGCFGFVPHLNPARLAVAYTSDGYTTDVLIPDAATVTALLAAIYRCITPDEQVTLSLNSQLVNEWRQP